MISKKHNELIHGNIYTHTKAEMSENNSAITKHWNEVLRLNQDEVRFNERPSSNEFLKNIEILASNIETECSRCGIDPLSNEGKLIREKLIRKSMSDNKKQDGEFMMNLFSIKFEHWKYEEESRLFSTLEGKENGHYYIYYSNGLKIRKVILRIRSSVTGDSVRHALGTGYDNVNIFKVCENHRKFAVVRDENWSPSQQIWFYKR